MLLLANGRGGGTWIMLDRCVLLHHRLAYILIWCGLQSDWSFRRLI